MSTSKINKGPFDVPKSDLVEMIFLPKGEVGDFNRGDQYFNHIYFNGELITDKDEVRKILFEKDVAMSQKYYNPIIMEKSKYYTPESQEFCTGFEYEYEDINEGGSSTSWYKGVIKEGEGYLIDQYFDDKYDLGVRVKHLDREDIESLGFEFDTNVDGDHYYYKGNPMVVKNYWMITFNTNESTIDVSDISSNNKMSFYGKIKNKSELKKVLKMIGVKG